MSLTNKSLFGLALLFFLNSTLWGIICSDFGEFKQYGGHYYAISASKHTFEQAKQIAQNNQGYLAIPNDVSENTFLSNTFGLAWIGIYDPMYTQSSLCYFGTTCQNTQSRFVSVNGSQLTFQNWDLSEPNNKLYQYDIIDNTPRVAPLGEHWVIIGSNGKWGDEGNHPESNNYPIKYKAIFEFDSMPECYEGNVTVPQERRCTESIYNAGTSSLISQNGSPESMPSYLCLTDTSGHEYCPAQLAPCAESFAYTNGTSQQHSGTTATCPNGYVPSATNPTTGLTSSCGSTNMNSTPQSTGYSCPSGTLASGQCCTTETTPATTTGYSCPSGGSLSSTSTTQCRDECVWWSSSGSGGKSIHTITGGSACGSTYTDVWGDGRADNAEGSCGTTLWTATTASSTPICSRSCTTTANCFDSCVWWANPTIMGGKSNHTITGGSLCGSSYTDTWGTQSGLIYQGSCGSSSWQVSETIDCSYMASASYSCSNPEYSLSGSTCYQSTCFPATQLHTCGTGAQNLSCSGNFPNAWLKSLYIDHLCRCPDQAGYDYWLGEISRIGYQATYDAIHDAATQNNETYSTTTCPAVAVQYGNPTCSGNYPNDWLFDIYFDHLCRCPDQAGYDYWLARLNAGVSQEQILEAIKIAATENNTPYQAYCGTVGSNLCFSSQIISTSPSITSYSYYTYHCPNTSNVYGETYIPSNPGGPGTTNPTPPTNNCSQANYTCQPATDRLCANVDNQWQCSPFPCFGEDNLENTDTVMGATDSTNQGFNDDGSCAGQIRLFNGKDLRCRSWSLIVAILGGNGCCQRETPGGLAELFGATCNENERLLSRYRRETMDKSHYIGEYVSRRAPIIRTPLEKKRTYCTFNSKLARIIQEQGREQTGIAWGDPKSPNCKGFTPEEFQRIDFSRLDLSEFYGDLQSRIQTTINGQVGTTIQQRVQSFGTNINGGSQ